MIIIGLTEKKSNNMNKMVKTHKQRLLRFGKDLQIVQLG